MARPLLLALCLLAACGQPPPRISLNEVEPEGAASGGSRLRIAIGPMRSTRQSFERYSGLFAAAGRLAGEPVELVQRQTLAEVVALVEHRRVFAALVCGGSYLRAQDDFGAVLLAVPRIDGATSYRAEIIVPRESPARGLGDLRGKTFALTDQLSTGGSIFPAWLLRSRNTSTDAFFGKVLFTKGHDNSIEAVAEGLADGASVSGQALADAARERPELARRVRVIERSPPLGNPPLIVHPGADPELRRRLESALLRLHEDPAGRAALAGAGIERFVRGDPGAYEEARRMRELVKGAPGT